MRNFAAARTFINAWLISLAVLLPAAELVKAENVASYSIGSWAQELGNYRARIKVAGKADAVLVHIPWRRHDSAPQDKDVIVRDAATGKQIANVARMNVGSESGDLVFQPATAPGDYELYYVPYTANPINAGYSVVYTPPQSKSDPAWIAEHRLAPEQLADGAWKKLPTAQLI